MKINSVYQTLGEQLNINESEIRQRKMLLGLNSMDEKILFSVYPNVEHAIAKTVAHFYEKQIEIDDIAVIIGDADTLARLTTAMNRYVQEVFLGKYETEYTNNRLRIGLIHKRIGVSPKYYLSSLLSLKQHLFSMLDECVTDPHTCQQTKYSLDKVLMYDCQLVFDAYFRSMLLEVEVARDRAEKHEMELETIVADRTRELEDLVRKDALTGLWNRRHFIEELFCEIVKSKRDEKYLSVIYIDLDGFKKLNDSKGHSAGDELLIIFGKMLMSICREEDTVARMGGDEFVILLPGLQTEQTVEIAQRMLNWIDHDHYGISMSIGIATAGKNKWPESPEKLLGLADVAMYQAKKNGGSQYMIADDIPVVDPVTLQTLNQQSQNA
ncbi:GGDEF domain-containing protein [Acinetobacter qingfengensis]|uniref:Diguanylate cyclase DosC n=1 Tax=Acinetobacter qingfengensis TaxID=1262585 RepID=A0A1E7R547_9GAMM|nr:GGDEF domain-containing protein [Acinetobacter qingfengensis]KAA8732438.1 GGDEF domain-containing protein [Acinetobacter qingfengensis]OEY94432.1 hypothetical protein BJI46_03570 [Acinetobacter qingfengensis]